MPSKQDKILDGVNLLTVKLYGENGFEGDIEEIKRGLENHGKRIRRIEFILVGLVGTGALGAGLLKLLGG